MSLISGLVSKIREYNDLQDCRYDLLNKITSKKWFNVTDLWTDEPFIIKDKIIFNRNCAYIIYNNNKYDLKDWDKLDKYLIEIIQNILDKYNINEIGFVGNCVDNNIDYNDIKTYYRNKENKWINVSKLTKDLNHAQYVFGIDNKQEIINDIQKLFVKKMSKQINEEILKEINKTRNE